MNKESNYRLINIAVAGEQSTGRLSLMTRLSENKFVEPYDNDRKFMVAVRHTFKSEHFKINLHLFKRYDRFRGRIYSFSKFLRKISAAIVIYDITERDSFLNIVKLINETKIDENPGSENKLVYFILGNKSDLTKYREVSIEEGEEYAKSVGALFMEISVKTSYNVNKILDAICERLPSKEDNPNENSGNVDMQAKNNTDAWGWPCYLE